MTDAKAFVAWLETLGCQMNEADTERMAGILVADRVVAVDGKKVLRADGFAAMAGVKGEEGTNVTLGAMATAATKDSSFPGGFGQVLPPEILEFFGSANSTILSNLHRHQYTRAFGGMYCTSLVMV